MKLNSGRYFGILVACLKNHLHLPMLMRMGFKISEKMTTSFSVIAPIKIRCRLIDPGATNPPPLPLRTCDKNLLTTSIRILGSL